MWCPLAAPSGPVVVLFFTGLFMIYLIRILIWRAGFFFFSFSFRDISFSISCLYAPNRNPARNDFFDELADTIDMTFPTFICGDFNTVLDRSMDRFGSDMLDYSCESSHALAHFF